MGVAIRSVPVRSVRQRGFTLIEALLALSILGMALLFEMSAQWQTRELLLGLEAESELLARAEAAVESIRAGVHPLVSGPVDSLLAWPVVEVDPSIALVLDVDSSDVAGLCRLRILGQSIGNRGRRHSLTLETLVWQPGATCL